MTKSLQPARIPSLDLLRGLVMILMALDHARGFFHAPFYIYDATDLSKTSVAIFFTRWITHFCAPVFVLLAGTSAFLSSRKKSKKQLAVFLIKRGLWLILLELTLIDFAWFFNIHFSYFGLQVIWALGVSMIFLAGIIFLPRKIILVLGIVLVAAHNLLDNFHIQGNGIEAFLWGVLHDRNLFHFGGIGVQTSYPVIPWIGLMALGYCLGEVFATPFDSEKRRKLLLTLGLSLTLLFIIVRLWNQYGDPHPWAHQSRSLFTFLSFLNLTKYPPSFLFLLMTIGPALIFLALAGKSQNRLGAIISTYGRVPLFYYVVHIFIIHAMAAVAAMLTGFKWSDMIVEGPRSHSPQLTGFGFGLWVVYGIWLIVVVLMYPLCKKYDSYKSKHKDKWWLSYL